MNYCTECKVAVSKTISNCPLCGSYTGDKEAAEDFFPQYRTELEPYVSYPKLGKINAKNTFLQTGLLRILLLVIAICITINLLIGGYFWAGHVISSAFVIYICVIMTIYKNRRFYLQITVNSFVWSIYLVIVDLLMPNGFSGFSLLYGVPGVILAGIILIDVMIALNPSSTRGYYFALLNSCFWGLIPQILIWSMNWATGFIWLPFGLFFFSIANYCIVIFLCYRHVKSEYKRKFHF